MRRDTARHDGLDAQRTARDDQLPVRRRALAVHPRRRHGSATPARSAPGGLAGRAVTKSICSSLTTTSTTSAGWPTFPASCPGAALVIHAAAEALTGVDPERAVAGLLRKPYNPRGWEDLEDIRVEASLQGLNEVAGHAVRVRAQQHTDISVAFRFDDELVLATDTRADPGDGGVRRRGAAVAARGLVQRRRPAHGRGAVRAAAGLHLAQRGHGRGADRRRRGRGTPRAHAPQSAVRRRLSPEACRRGCKRCSRGPNCVRTAPSSTRAALFDSLRVPCG